ncbi:hypothetical protein U5801_06935 [Lamprobacter modestohalophilus]|uniref:hypothetical protein n=1 Tax=Lamprobacter modestohalophilus TaxID=1064514 RepID=UPI002ADECC17|nr:hypothetical protein [Lamprobacter modestohalophilus]MEA1049538.1 hypothetical protein [Lamprobacter modestohalophilus]
MIALEIKTIGNAATVTLPPQALALLNAKVGDTLYLSAAPEGVLLSPYSPELTRQMQAAEEIMREDQDVLREICADGFSLNDKHTPQPDKSDLPDILTRWQALPAQGHDAEAERKRTEQNFLVPKAEIAGNDYDLSINRHKEFEYEAVEYDPPQVILERLAKLDEEIAEGRKELVEMLA